MSEDNYSTWKLSPKLPKDYYIADIHYDFDYLTLTIADGASDETILEVRFLYPIAHRVANESHRLRLLSHSAPLAFVVVVEPSDFLQWVQEESFDTWNYDRVRHFILSDSEWIVDVLADEDPELHWKTNANAK